VVQRILLDDAGSSDDAPSSRLYENCITSWTVAVCDTDSASEELLRHALNGLQSALSRGEYVVAALSYELGGYFHGLPKRDTKHPLLQIWSFADYQLLSKNAVDAWLDEEYLELADAEKHCGILNAKPSVDFKQFSADLDRIHEYVLSGDTYQINHTFRITGDCYGSPLALYRKLRTRQPGRYGALIEENGQWILSLSPELFLQCRQGKVQAMPMKGTASALETSPERLSKDAKNQAENLMIVDLLRNDLGQIATTGSIHVPSMFDVARYGDVLQMTSTVEAILKPNVDFRTILEAIFPCGSITGAPKKRSMEIIRELEPISRDYYCGALGWFDPNGDFALSVPIRTLEIEQAPNASWGTFTLGVGAGITVDSNPHDEWEECRTKARFLSDLPSGTGIFETILVKNGQAQRLDSHLDRIERSALTLHIPFDRMKASALIRSACNSLDTANTYRLRLDLNERGNQSISKGLLEALPDSVKIFWARDMLANSSLSVMNSKNALLAHKSHSRALYDEAWQAAVAHGGFDALFTNEAGFVTEGGRSNLFIRLKGCSEWLTPPCTAGLLPGIMRSNILTDSKWNARESNITIDDVLGAEKIMLTNALRGAMSAHF